MKKNQIPTIDDSIEIVQTALISLNEIKAGNENFDYKFSEFEKRNKDVTYEVYISYKDGSDIIVGYTIPDNNENSEKEGCD